MLILKSSASERSVDSAPYGSYLSRLNDLYFHCASGFFTQILAYMLDSLVRVSRRVDETHFVSIAIPPTSSTQSVSTCRTNRTMFSYALEQTGLGNCKRGISPSVRTNVEPEVYKGPRRDPSSNWSSPTIITDADPSNNTGPPGSRTATQHKEWDAPLNQRYIYCQTTTGFQPFPLNNFKYFLTLFSKFFSSFPHGTCSLSVSRRYLALDELYHPISAALPSNATLRTYVVRVELRIMDGILTLYDVLLQRTYTRVDTDRTSIGYNPTNR